MVNKLSNRRTSYKYSTVFAVAFLTALVMLLPFIIYDKGFFLYCGDFNSQQIPFTMEISEWFYNGLNEYSFGIDLGGSFVNSYSFYTLGSPFAMILMLFPERAIPYLMPLMLCIKFATAALTGYMFISRYLVVKGYAFAASLLYAFSGFSIYNIFFNHFLDPVALFPLLLFSLDEFFYNNRKGAFAVSVAINLLNNYFFFAGQVVFLIIYFIVRLISGEYKLTPKKFAFIAFESIVGVMMGLLLALPAFMSLFENPRSISYSYGFNLLLHGTSQQYWAIISSMLFPPDPPYLPNLFTDGVIKWTSMSAYIPVFSIAGVVAYFRNKGRSSIKTILMVCLIMALVPILNSAFYTFNSSYYARWFYMPLLLMALATGKAMEFSTRKFASSLLVVGGITLSYSAFGLVPDKVDGETVIGLADRPSIFWLTIFTTIIGLVIGYIWLVFFKRGRLATPILLAFICIFSVLYGIIHMATGKIPQLENDSSYKAQNYDAMELDMFADDTEFYRTDGYKTHDNNSIFLDINGIQFFNSVVSPSILEFYPSIGVKRDVSSKPEWSNTAIRSLLSVKYLLVPTDEESEFLTNELLYGFSFYEKIEPYSIYINELFLPMGFVLSEYITEDSFNSVDDSLRSNILLRSIMLNDEQIVRYSDFMTELPEDRLYVNDYDSLVNDVNAMTTADNFVDTGNGFTADINVDSTSMVMFSVPYDKGFTAYIDGTPTTIEEVNNGLMAIVVPSGQHSIEFVYATPYLTLSMYICFIGIVLYIVYIAIDRYGQRNRVIKSTAL